MPWFPMLLFFHTFIPRIPLCVLGGPIGPCPITSRLEGFCNCIPQIPFFFGRFPFPFFCFWDRNRSVFLLIASPLPRRASPLIHHNSLNLTVRNPRTARQHYESRLSGWFPLITPFSPIEVKPSFVSCFSRQDFPTSPPAPHT